MNDVSTVLFIVYSSYSFYCLSTRLSTSIEISDQVGHLRGRESGPLELFRLHLVQHARAVPPESGHHGDGGEIARVFREIGSATGGIVVAGGAFLGGKNLLSVGRAAVIQEDLLRPQITHDLPHLTFLKIRRRLRHFRSMIPHVRCNVRESLVFQARRQVQLARVAAGASFGAEQGFSVVIGASLKVWSDQALRRDIAHVNDNI